MRGEKREREESGTNNKPLQNKPSEFRKPYLASEACNNFGKDTKKHEKCFLYSLSSLLRGPLQRRGPTPPWWTEEAERKGNKCVALGGIGMWLASEPPLSEAIPA